MVLPALGALAVKFAPQAVALAGSLAAPILSSLFGAKNEQQARDAVAPQYSAMMQRLMSQGMGKVEATRAAEEALLPEIAKAKEEGALPGWAEGLLSVAGGVGGFALGKKLLAKGAAKAVAGAAPKNMGLRGRDPAKKMIDPPPSPRTLGEQGPEVDPASLERGLTTTPKRTRTVTDEAYSARKDEIDSANKAAADAGRFDRVVGQSDSGGQVIPFKEAAPDRYADEVLSPFPGRKAPHNLPHVDNAQTAEFELTPPQARIGHEPVVGSAPDAMPMSGREDFRRFLAQEERAAPKAPPRVLRAFPGLSYDEGADIAAQMRMHPEAF